MIICPRPLLQATMTPLDPVPSTALPKTAEGIKNPPLSHSEPTKKNTNASY